MRRLVAWWRCRRECGVTWFNGHPWAVHMCDRPLCPARAWYMSNRVNA